MYKVLPKSTENSRPNSINVRSRRPFVISTITIMSHPPLYASSIGSLIKRIVDINPNLRVDEIRHLIRQATHVEMVTIAEGEETIAQSMERVDEPKALKLARNTLDQPREKTL